MINNFLLVHVTKLQIQVQIIGTGNILIVTIC